MSKRAVTTMVLALAAAVGLSSCGKKIGDDCQTATDCDPNGARICESVAAWRLLHDPRV